MKKAITIILSTAIALCAFAKTGDELIAEYWSKATGMNDYPVAKAIVDANTADVKTAISVWANGDAGKFNTEEKRSEQSKKDVQAARLMAGSYLVRNPGDIKSLPVLFACEVISSKVVDAYAVENPSFYAELKAGDFKVNGVKLRPNSICNIAISAGDLEYVMSLPIDGVVNNINYQSILKKQLLVMDVATAKAKITEIENWYLLKDREIPSSIKAISKVLTSRLVDEKLRK
jgi:hypothetical protein